MSALKHNVLFDQNGYHQSLLKLSKLPNMLHSLLNKLKPYINEKLGRGAENYPSKNFGRGTNLDPSKMYFPLCDSTFVSFYYAKHLYEKHTRCLLHMQLHNHSQMLHVG
jgi:hypothetical protein